MPPSINPSTRPTGPQAIRAVKRLAALGLMLTLVAGCAMFNRYQTRGRLVLEGLRQPVKVVRDEKGMPYIYAANLEDAYRAMGFVAAQDRLFQMELTRRVAAGRIAEVAGPEALPLDRRMRTIGIYRHARRHAAMLDKDSAHYVQAYLDGVNCFVRTRKDDYHLEFALSGIKPEPWEVADAFAIMYYMSWNTSANIKTEIIAQMLVDKVGRRRAATIFPLNINPDAPAPDSAWSAPVLTAETAARGRVPVRSLAAFLADGPLGIGSNNWAAGPALAPGGQPIVACDVHLDPRILPGPWYPCGIITPALRVVGVHIPGLPAFALFRSTHLAAGVTNAYADVQDLYVETLDPQNPARYLEGNRAIPFRQHTETLRYKDDDAPGGFGAEKLVVRQTHRGPVISDVFPMTAHDRVLSLRWALPEAMGPSIDFTKSLVARNAAEFRESLRQWHAIALNFVFADREGNIGWHVSGSLPIRRAGDGTVPFVVKDGSDNWAGWVPFEVLPHDFNPAKNWLGTCNHKTVTADYPYYYSSYQATSCRYRRLKQLMEAPGLKSAADHWRFQRDTVNLVAQKIVPIMVRVLEGRASTRAMGRILADWNFQDDPDLAAPTIFHAVYDRFAYRVFVDELGPEVTMDMLQVWYFWQERLQRMVCEGRSIWFDDVDTPASVETLDDVMGQAAEEAQAALADRLGADMQSWRWGRVHTVEFVSPIRRKGFGRGILGGGTHAAPGSVETLYRGIYDYDSPFAVTIAATVRMVADLGDPQKVLAVLPGGVAGRLFHPHSEDQIKAYMDGEATCWWFSDAQIRAHAQTELTMAPPSGPAAD
jgi:penicillin amidase